VSVLSDDLLRLLEAVASALASGSGTATLDPMTVRLLDTQYQVATTITITKV
jgi:hypothetical protein